MLRRGVIQQGFTRRLMNDLKNFEAAVIQPF